MANNHYCMHKNFRVYKISQISEEQDNLKFPWVINFVVFYFVELFRKYVLYAGDVCFTI